MKISFRVIHDVWLNSYPFLYIKSWMSRDIYSVKNSTMSRIISIFFFQRDQHVIVVHLVSLEWIWIQYLLHFLGIRPKLAAQKDSLDLTILFFQFHFLKFSPPSDVTKDERSSSDSGTNYFWWQLHWFHRVFDTGCFADFLFLSHSWLRNSRILPSFSETLIFRTVRWIRVTKSNNRIQLLSKSQRNTFLLLS